MRYPDMNHDYTHPERHHEGLIFAPGGQISEEVRAQRRGLRQMGYAHNSDPLCWACGWNTYNELNSSYGPRVKIFHTRGNIGVWAIGSQWLLRDQPNDGSIGNDFMTQQFLRQQPGLDVPLVKDMYRLGQPTDQIQFTLFSRAQGDTLYSIWNSLTEQERLSYSKQLAGYIKQLRQFTAPAAMKVDGSQLDDVIIGHCHRRHPPTCKKIGYTADEWFDNIADELRRGLSIIHDTKDETTIEVKLQELKENLPPGEPYTLTHGDLNLANIIVKDGKIEAIIDWEMAGYYPWWAERWLSHMGNDHRADDLFYPLWAEVMPEKGHDTFQTEVISKLAPILEAWDECPRDHPDFYTSWLRPGFCECKPYAGRYRWLDIGNEVEHKIREPN